MPLPSDISKQALAPGDAAAVVLRGSYARGDSTARSDVAYLLTPTLPCLPADFAGWYDALWRGDAASRAAAYIKLSE